MDEMKYIMMKLEVLEKKDEAYKAMLDVYELMIKTMLWKYEGYTEGEN